MRVNPTTRHNLPRQANWQFQKAGGRTFLLRIYPPTTIQEDEGLFSPLYKFPLAKKVLNIEENKKALPDPHPPPYGKPITVIIADEILVSQQYQVRLPSIPASAVRNPSPKWFRFVTNSPCREARSPRSVPAQSISFLSLPKTMK